MVEEQRGLQGCSLLSSLYLQPCPWSLFPRLRTGVQQSTEPPVPQIRQPHCRVWASTFTRLTRAPTVSEALSVGMLSQLFIEHLLYARYCSRHWNPAVNKTAEAATLLEPGIT